MCGKLLFKISYNLYQKILIFPDINLVELAWNKRKKNWVFFCFCYCYFFFLFFEGVNQEIGAVQHLLWIVANNWLPNILFFWALHRVTVVHIFNESTLFFFLFKL